MCGRYWRGRGWGGSGWRASAPGLAGTGDGSALVDARAPARPGYLLEMPLRMHTR